jgi:RNA polymerase sigma factor (sigma-70 family)
MLAIVPTFSHEYDLAKALSNKEARAQHVFYERYAGKFLSICKRYVSDIMVAEDIMVESMMKIFDKVNQFNFNGSFEGWAKRIVVNEALMHVRKKKEITIDIAEAEYEVEHSFPSFDFEAEELLKLIQTLPDGYRTVFNLYAIEGYSHAEICDSLGISEGTSKSQLSRARKFLADALQNNPKYGYIN